MSVPTSLLLLRICQLLLSLGLLLLLLLRATGWQAGLLRWVRFRIRIWFWQQKQPQSLLQLQLQKQLVCQSQLQ